MPPGYVHEDIIEFALAIIKSSVLAENDQIELGQQNKKMALELIKPLLEDNALLALTNKFTSELMQTSERKKNITVDAEEEKKEMD